MDWNKIQQLLEISSHLPGHPHLTHLRSAVLKELQKISDDLAEAPSEVSRADLKAAKASAPEPTAQTESTESNVIRNTYEGLPGPAERRI